MKKPSYTDMVWICYFALDSPRAVLRVFLCRLKNIVRQRSYEAVKPKMSRLKHQSRLYKVKTLNVTS